MSDGPVTLACAPPLSLLAEEVAGALGGIEWPDAPPAGVAGAGEAPGADEVTVVGTNGAAPPAAGVIAGWAAAEVGEVVLAAEVADGPQVGKFEFSNAWEAVAPCPTEGNPTLTPRFDATGAPNSRTTTNEPTTTAPLSALMAEVSLRRRRERLGLIGACPPRNP